MASQQPVKLFTGALSDTAADLYENTGSDSVIFRSLVLINKGANPDVRAYIAVDRGSGDVLIDAPKLNQQYTAYSQVYNITLENGDKLRGYADVDDAINCVADGVDISP